MSSAIFSVVDICTAPKSLPFIFRLRRSPPLFVAPHRTTPHHPNENTQGKIQRLGVTQLELKIVSGLGADAGGVLAPIRVVASNPTGYAVRVETYVEVCHGMVTCGRVTYFRALACAWRGRKAASSTHVCRDLVLLRGAPPISSSVVVRAVVAVCWPSLA